MKFIFIDILEKSTSSSWHKNIDEMKDGCWMRERMEIL